MYAVLQFVIQMNVVLQFLIRMYVVCVLIQFAIQIVPFIQNYILIQINVILSTVYYPVQIDLLKGKVKVISATGREGPWGSETSRLLSRQLAHRWR
jgi:hypothetical protein